MQHKTNVVSAVAAPPQNPSRRNEGRLGSASATRPDKNTACTGIAIQTNCPNGLLRTGRSQKNQASGNEATRLNAEKSSADRRRLFTMPNVGVHPRAEAGAASRSASGCNDGLDVTV